VKLGVQVPHFGPNAGAAAIDEVARIAEDIGLDSLWVSDHVVFPSAGNSSYPHSSKGLPVENLSPFFEAITTLAYLAGTTRTARLGTSILLPGMRQPVLAAKMLASIDALSGGRLVLGLGAGWLEAEFALLEGVEFKRRGAALEEIVAIWRTLWSNRTASFEGEFFQFDEMIFDPLPAQSGGPPIWIGGNSKAAIRRAARIGDGWHAARVAPAELSELVTLLGEEAETHGRSLAEVEPSVTVVYRTGDDEIDPERLRDLVGGPELIAEQIGRYAEAGAETIVLGLDPRHDLDQHRRDLAVLAEEILPRLGDLVAADA
jgi:probable F420-dependent oxidoreductase